MKKILVGFLTLAAVFTVLPMFAAFEAHVINVTAKIENAMSVPVDPLDFGTVFPQEHLDKKLDITLSDSFLAEDRVESVEYMIRQKPKCAWTWDGGESFDQSSTVTGHVVVNTSTPEGDYTIDCGEEPETRPEGVPENANWGVLPSLCEYISKHSEATDWDEETDEPIAWEDGALASFHQPFEIDQDGNIVWTEVNGMMSKPSDQTDSWTIDLAVPCFGGYCAQDWADFVHGINPQANPDDYVQDKNNEHKVFGCDLWFEVTGVNEVEEEVNPTPAP